MGTVVEMPGLEAVAEKALSLPERARAIQIADAASYEAACEFLKGIKAVMGEIDALFDPRIKDAHQLHRSLLDDKARMKQEPTEAERIVKDAIVRYDCEQERLRLDEQRRLEEEARRAEEVRRLELAAALEREADEASKAEAEAIVEEMIAAPVYVPVAPVARMTPKVSGVTTRSTWSAHVVNLYDLVKFVAANPSHIGLISANMPALNAQARSLKGSLRLPGVRPVETRDVAASARR